MAGAHSINYAICIEFASGATSTMSMTPDSPVVMLKKRIEEAYKIPVAQQKLIFNDIELDNSLTFEECNIGAHATVRLVEISEIIRPPTADRVGILQVVILLGGEGLRFSTSGYLRPKMLVRIHGKPMIYWALRALKLSGHHRVTIAYHSRLRRWNFAAVIRNALPEINFHMVEVPFNTRGATESALLTARHLNPELPMVILDGDAIHTEDILARVSGSCIFYKDTLETRPIFSYVRLLSDTASSSGGSEKDAEGEDGSLVLEIKEKDKISPHACIGVYAFETAGIFIDAAEKVIDRQKTSKGEYYISNVYAQLLEDKHPIRGLKVEHYVSVGTPRQVQEYLFLFGKDPSSTATTIQGLKVVFDFDNTLFTEDGTTDALVPVDHVVDLVRKFNQGGAHITVQTERTEDSYPSVRELLNRYQIPFDVLRFDKPQADLFIDDMAVNPYIHLFEECGMSEGTPNTKPEDVLPDFEISHSCVQARAFHRLEVTPKEVRKTGYASELASQRFFFENIPSKIQHFFAPLLSVEEKNGLLTLAMQRINGVPLSYAYVHGTLTIGQLDEIFESLRMMHNCESTPIDSSLSKYTNWSSKLKQRFAHRFSDTYCNFFGADLFYKRLMFWLEKYEREDRGAWGHVIHGDGVFTNAILRASADGGSRVCWVDMKGALGATHTLNGDVFYDWSKIFQSLLGYDYILHNLPEPLEKAESPYTTRLREHFFTRFRSWFGDEQLWWTLMLTSQFMLALLPQHLDTPKESVQFYKCGVRWLRKAEENLAKYGHVVDPNIVAEQDWASLGHFADN
eukprot:GILJ01003829.1.p1 GENE.GILJ01003829.1~~GILJ01003829.1.p1  ORF type:complete len:812 (+),score=126.85 GILJ01003829.1:47-2437(+)